MSVFQNFLFQSRVNQTLVLGKVIYLAPDGQSYYFVTSEKVWMSEQNGHQFPIRHYSVRRMKGNSVTYAEGTTKGQFRQRIEAHAHAATLGTKDQNRDHRKYPVAVAPKPEPKPAQIKMNAYPPGPKPAADPDRRISQLETVLNNIKRQLAQVEAEVQKRKATRAPEVEPWMASFI